MNTAVSLRIVFIGSSNRRLAFVYPHVRSDITQAEVQTLANAIIENDIWAEVPQVLHGAELITRGVQTFSVA